MSGGGGGSTKTTTVNDNSPWKPAQPYVLQGASDLDSWMKGGGQKPYTGNTFAPMTPESELANKLRFQNAYYGNPYDNMAQSENMKWIQGTNANQGYQDNFIRNQMNQVIPGMETNANQLGRLGSDQNNLVRGQALGNIAYNAYAPMQQNQMNALGLASNLAKSDYTNLNAINQAGLAQRTSEQGLMDAQKQQWMNSQYAPMQNLDFYTKSLLGLGSLGGTSATSQTQQLYGQSPLTQALGAGMLGYGMYNNLFPNTGAGQNFAQAGYQNAIGGNMSPMGINMPNGMIGGATNNPFAGYTQL